MITVYYNMTGSQGSLKPGLTRITTDFLLCHWHTCTVFAFACDLGYGSAACR